MARRGGPLSHRPMRALVLFVVLLAAAPAGAEELRLRLAARWIGLPAGEIALSLSEGEGRYVAHAEVRAVGVPRLLTGFRAEADSEGALEADDGPQPGVRYAADYRLRGRDKRTRFAYAADGETSLPARATGDSADRDELPPAERADAFDPLAALVAFRTRLLQGRIAVDVPFRLAVYDGRRRFDVEGVIAPARLDPARGVRVHDVALTLHPRAGFSARDLADEQVDPEARPARLIVTADGRALPLEFEVPAAGFTLAVRLTEACGAWGCVRPKDNDG
jgi:hypothetical protein